MINIFDNLPLFRTKLQKFICTLELAGKIQNILNSEVTLLCRKYYFSEADFIKYFEFTLINVLQIITVVVDTNILISNLGLFEMLKDYQLQSKLL